MVSPNVQQLFKAVQSLSPGDRRQLREKMSRLPEAIEPSGDPDEILLARGVLRSVPPGKDPARLRVWRSVEIEGKPLSETIIEERR